MCKKVHPEKRGIYAKSRTCNIPETCIRAKNNTNFNSNNHYLAQTTASSSPAMSNEPWTDQIAYKIVRKKQKSLTAWTKSAPSSRTKLVVWWWICKLFRIEIHSTLMGDDDFYRVQRIAVRALRWIRSVTTLRLLGLVPWPDTINHTQSKTRTIVLNHSLVVPRIPPPNPAFNDRSARTPSSHDARDQRNTKHFICLRLTILYI